MHITEAELEDSQITRLIIKEDIEGEKICVTLTKSEIVLGGGEVAIKVSSDKDEEAMKEFFDIKSSDLMKRYNFESLTLNLTSVKNNPNYLFPGPVLIIRSARAIKEGGQYDLSPESIPSLAAFFGVICVPQINPPTSMILAIQKKSKGTLNKILKRLRQLPSMYGVADFVPKYYVCFGRLDNPEERDQEWHI